MGPTPDIAESWWGATEVSSIGYRPTGVAFERSRSVGKTTPRGFFPMGKGPFFVRGQGKIPLLFKEGLGVVDINPTQPPLYKGDKILFLCSRLIGVPFGKLRTG